MILNTDYANYVIIRGCMGTRNFGGKFQPQHTAGYLLLVRDPLHFLDITWNQLWKKMRPRLLNDCVSLTEFNLPSNNELWIDRGKNCRGIWMRSSLCHMGSYTTRKINRQNAIKLAKLYSMTKTRTSEDIKWKTEISWLFLIMFLATVVSVYYTHFAI